MTAPYPLVFRPLLLEKVWGGRRLERLGKQLPPGKPIGESWEVADLEATSTSGAGGAAARSVIANGPLAGKTLHDALGLWGDALVDSKQLAASGGFPLLVKFLDASENLSVQVHPSPAFAQLHPQAHLKTECWYILEAEPGSVIYKGVKPGVTRETFARHIEQGTVVDDLVAVSAIKGEMHNLPSGTVHALGAGVLVAEVQTPSDTTFRVHDWGRVGRELHVQQALECIEFGPAPEATRWSEQSARSGAARLVNTEYFHVDEVVTAHPTSHLGHVLLLLEGSTTLRPVTTGFDPLELRPGATCVVPAALRGNCELHPVSKLARVLTVRV